MEGAGAAGPSFCVVRSTRRLIVLRFVYSLLLYVLAPLALAATALRGVRDPAYRDRLSERFGFTRAAFDVQPLWVHAVSVGEVQAAAPLVRALAREYPQLPILMTTATPTGAQRVVSLFGDRVRHAYLPYDLPGSVARFLDRTRPRVAIVMEREIWPNLFRACDRRNVPLVFASARLSPTSMWRFGWTSSLIRGVLARNASIAAQTSGDAERFQAIGADPSRVKVTGNIKFDIEVDDTVRSAGASIRETQFPGRPVWIAGSTHAGEESIVLQAHARVRQTLGDALLILVPRHPPRFAEVRALLVSRDWHFASRSANDQVDAHVAVLLVDTLGELMSFYAAADVAFVAGSLVPIGGHNLLEPAALGLPIVVGPHNFNAPDIAQLMLSSGAAIEVANEDQLAETVIALLSDQSRRQDMGARARSIVDANRGALEATMQILRASVRAPG
jgi:3-deoxy-D-manno-octulosonic-acid transferase